MNLQTASVLILAPLVLLMVAMVVAAGTEISKLADKCQWARFELCVAKTGKSADDSAYQGHDVKGYIYVRIGVIPIVVPLAEHDCVMVEAPGMGTAALVGTEAEIMAKLSPKGCD